MIKKSKEKKIREELEKRKNEIGLIGVSLNLLLKETEGKLKWVTLNFIKET